MSQNYRVLARAYRPQHFGQLIGQDVLVRTLTNAIQMNRVAQAYMLTGVRGVGKTTTARIIAKSLNCSTGPTSGPTDGDPICDAITAGTHPDVIEIDAASNRGIDKMRDLLETVQYAPMEARYKVYIIDEVHMLTTEAFNALLKTLEEPPPHVVFIFATTEIRKVPVTILSRCQRFDLKRVDPETLATHLRNISDKEGARVEDPALALLARAADGSVRDSLSLLDRAIALATDGVVNEALVKDMLGLSDHRAVFDLWALAISGQTQGALAKADSMRREGADPLRLSIDLCELTHRAARAKIGAPQGDDGPGMAGIIDTLSIPGLNRAWSLCLKGMQDISQAPDPAAALDLTLIRLGYAAGLPDPGKLIKELHNAPAMTSPQPSFVPDGGQGSMLMQGNGAPVMAVSHSVPQLETLQDVVALAQAHNEPRLVGEIRQSMRIVSLRPGVLEVVLEPHADQTLTQRLQKFLSQATGERWMISIARNAENVAAPTLAQKEAAELDAKRKEVLDNPVVADILALFPGAQLVAVKNKEQD